MLSQSMVSDWWPFWVTTSFPLGTAVTLKATVPLPTYNDKKFKEKKLLILPK
jgi:hypothetical protein